MALDGYEKSFKVLAWMLDHGTDDAYGYHGKWVKKGKGTKEVSRGTFQKFYLIQNYNKTVESGGGKKMHEIEVNIRFCETDLLGHVNNNNFFVYMEDARINFFKDLDLVGDDWNFIIASTKCDFIKQVYFDQTLLIRSHVGRIGNSSFHLEQEMFEKDSGELVAKGLSVVVHFDFEHQESSPLSQKMRESLESFQLATK